MTLDDIKTIEIEITTRCNARCPQCVRNYYGSTEWENLPIIDMDLNDFKNQIPDTVWNNLKHIKFCGTYGDPIMHKRFTEFISVIKNKNKNIKISIHTNGGLRSKNWWAKLAKQLSNNDQVFFGIDGLEDTNHIHRIGVNFNKVIENLSSFNDAGGRSIWSYLVFGHNEHQVDEARDLSQKLKCADFKVKSTSRFVDKQHNYIDKAPVMDMDHNIIYWIKPAKGKYRNTGYDNVTKVIKDFGSWEEYLKTVNIDCVSKRTDAIYLAANGDVFPCGWLADRMYGYETESHADHKKIIKLINKLGGPQKINFFRTDLYEIIGSGWFKLIEDSWSNNDRLQRCANQCGTNLISIANKELKDLMVD